ncbi:MAG: vancomycin high temperature exclusion protein [Planctomycetota bacterium]
MGTAAGDGRGPGRRWRRRLLLGALALTLAAAAMHQHVLWSASGHLHELDDVAPRETAIVLGARIHPDGTPTPMLADRLRAAATLWHEGKCRRVLLSGDGSSRPGYDEVAAMRAAILALDVPAAAVLEDRFGLRTLDSMHRARDAFGIEAAIVVSNPFHIGRAVFLARQHGIDAVGVSAPLGASYSRSTLWRNRGREVLARVRAWLDVFVLGTRPRVPR